MASFDTVNYSLRTNKGIQRSIVFDGVRLLKTKLGLEKLGYVGLGSIWFTDFQAAHKALGIREMYSLEDKKIGFSRAKFNQPFKTVTVMFGTTSKALPKLFNDPVVKKRPWLIWLDYDKGLGESVVDDLRLVVERAPSNSILVATVNCGQIGPPRQRPDRLRALLGNVVPDDLSADLCQDGRIPETLSSLLLDFLTSHAANNARPGGFVPAFKLLYRDSSSMVTFGGVLPDKRKRSKVAEIIAARSWPSMVNNPIIVPPLTWREAAVLQAQLPSNRKLTRKMIRSLGFDLEVEHVKSFEKFYRYYPFFAQISA